MNTNVVDQSQLLALAYEDLEVYAIAQYPQFQRSPHLELMISKLEAIERGEINRLMIFLPPRHSKSLTGSSVFPAWYLGRHPDRQVIFASYGQELSEVFGRSVRNFLMDPVHQAVFPNCRISEDSSAAHRFHTTGGGVYYAVGRGGAITGRGAHLLIIDDPIKDREEANSETIRRSLQEWFAYVAYTRLMPNGAVVLIQTRWHDDDLAGWLLREHANENWEVLSLPAIAEQDESFRREGEALWPERYPVAVLERIRDAIGSAAFTSLYQQRPAAAEGAIFKRDWWQFYNDGPPKPSEIIQSWDTGFKTGAENSFSVCTTWAVAKYGYFLLSVWRGRVEFPELRRTLIAQAEQWKPSTILVEDRASGQSLLQELKTATMLPVVGIRADSDKLTRAQAITAMVEAGRVFLPEAAPWLNDFINEFANFPTGLHDDQIDSTTQALNYFREQEYVRPSIIFPESVRPLAPQRETLWDALMLGYPLTEDDLRMR
jgi:predicted phage terminase large subunit-like protein